MRLELHILNIRDIRFGQKTEINQGILHIDRDELKALLEKDRRLDHVDIELARPGEKCRILQVAPKVAGLQTSTYLARAGKDLKPDDIELYEMPSLTEITKDMEGLPKITYIFQILSLQYEPIPGEPTLFGVQAGRIVPTILHPNYVVGRGHHFGASGSAHPDLSHPKSFHYKRAL